jgi:hypothetical protein
LIKEFPRREYPAGYNQLWWDGRDIAAQPAASGIYLLRLQAADDYENRKIILLK